MLKNINQALLRINNHSINTPLEFSERLSNKYNCEVFLKREDLQKTRSFKIRGSLNNILKNYNKLRSRGFERWFVPSLGVPQITVKLFFMVQILSLNAFYNFRLRCHYYIAFTVFSGLLRWASARSLFR